MKAVLLFEDVDSIDNLGVYRTRCKRRYRGEEAADILVSLAEET